MADNDEGGSHASDPAVLDPQERPAEACAYGHESIDWTCPRDPRDDGDYCIFHAPVSTKQPEEVRDAFVAALKEPGKQAKAFIGARLSSLDLSFETIHPPDNYPIDLRYASIEDRLDCAYTKFDSILWLANTEIGTCNFEGASFRDEVNLEDASVGEFRANKGEFVDGITAEGLSVANDSLIRGDLSFQRARFGDRVELTELTVDGELDLTDASVQGQLALGSADVDGDIEARRLNCEGRVWLREASVGGDLELSKASVAGDVSLGTATIVEGVDMTDVEIDEGVEMTHCTVGGSLEVSDADFEDSLLLASAEVGAIEGRSATFRDDVHATGITVSTGVSLDDVDAWSLNFMNSTLGETVELNGTAERIYFDNTTLTEPGVFDLSGVTAESGRITLPADTPVVYDFTDATLGDIKLATNDDDAHLFERFRFENTTFDGFDFGPYSDDLAAVDWRIDTLTDAVDIDDGISDGEIVSEMEDVAALIEEANEHETESISEMFAATIDASPVEFDVELEDIETTDDLQETLHEFAERAEEELEGEKPGGPTAGELENTYLKAKNGADRTGADEMAARFFIREMKFRRQRHANEFRTGDSIHGRLKSGWDWVTNLTLDVVAGYGERPRNVVGVSIGLVFAFGGIYQLMNALPSGSGTRDYVLFSLQNFVAFLIGSNPRGTLAVRYVSATEAFLGAFLIALFVFTLTRSLNR
ncbi:hypothetical protein [Halobellus ruber]|uniref:Pentapeptide repeat-containing protein n=1 Tax=Halobellus ruber TaxID=2761102 RepID=A0A7J9SKB5_9EURY|nr:hypothetical protein [Halobellus ruber]MBB6646559.1 hypothetical protein [Halobellus ruber]